MSDEQPAPEPDEFTKIMRRYSLTSPTPGDITEAARRAAEAAPLFAKAVSEVARRLSEALAPLIEYARQHPDWREELERERAEDPGPCRCLCGPVHGSGGVCEGEAAPGLVRVHHGHGVAVCRACYQAGLVLAPGAEVTEL
jgi:hypothetical protein